MDVTTFLQNIIPIKNKNLRKIIKETATIETIKARTHFGNKDEPEAFIRFLIHGNIRGYIMSPQGKEITICFLYKPGDVLFGSDYLGYDHTDVGFHVVKDSEIFKIPVKTMMDYMGDYPELSQLYITILTQCLSYHWETKKMLYMKTAKERYEWFLKAYPGLIESENNANIASLLNITPVTLSRIRHSAPENNG